MKLSFKGERFKIMQIADTQEGAKVSPDTLNLINTAIDKEKPDLIVSSGAAVAVPFFWLGKLAGCKTVYIEVFDRRNSATMTGRLVYPVTDKFIVQWEEMRKVYPKAVNFGSLF